MALISWPTHAILAISHGPTRPQQAILYWASPYPTAPILRPTHHPLAVPLGPPHTLRPTPSLGSPIDHGKLCLWAHPIATAPPPPQPTYGLGD
ncbi:hypothetical protein PAXRUDRAFT_20397 [Paxillus rubicundulus Ve08.2h10]|uniref:Unplaced genomic scaffold scaffold_4509, whole genome shotgun sequence n=1 Tax=Paxillus rubicundulus Ve08.2h10 TaxID=930991 RepID=A0A0D0BQU2_9AGAM|nr:hypothetical protein PAXRUDRAFT_20397 [Paxillus rubicundulus Ve08.2h10]